jgi:LytS/YehU family sensor histidine kinase
VNDYLEIQKARFGDRLRFLFDIRDGVAGLKVPPFSVQSLVENAVKHGIRSGEDGGEIEIAANREGNDLLRIVVRDTGAGFTLADVNAGHGLDNLISRLDTLFGSGASLQVGRDDNWRVVSLPISTCGGSLVVRLKDAQRTELTVARNRVADVKKHLGL